MIAKRILIVLAAAAGLLALAAAAAFNPRVQTWAARRHLAAARGERVSVSGVSADLGQASIVGLRIDRDDMVLLAPSVHADMAVAPALLGHGYHIDALTAGGLCPVGGSRPVAHARRGRRPLRVQPPREPLAFRG